jgi:hypothetical protein
MKISQLRDDFFFEFQVELGASNNRKDKNCIAAPHNFESE